MNAKKFTSAVVAVLTGFSMAVPMISTAEEGCERLTYTSTEKSATFFTGEGNNSDFIVSSDSPYFKTQRYDGCFILQPEASTTYNVSEVVMKTERIPLGFGHEFHYFYPYITNYTVTYSVKNGTHVEYAGEKSFYNYDTIYRLTMDGAVGFSESAEAEDEREDAQPFVHVEMYGDGILKNPLYYAYASADFMNTADYANFFTLYDYALDSKKDKSLFCLKNCNFDGDISGNIEVSDIIHGPSNADSNLNKYTNAECEYMLISPTDDDGMGEITYYDNCDYDIEEGCYEPLFHGVQRMLRINGGRFVSTWTMGCEFPAPCDLDMDEEITVADMVIMNKYLLGTTKLTNVQRTVADVYPDGIIDGFDFILMKQKYFGKNPIVICP